MKKEVAMKKRFLVLLIIILVLGVASYTISASAKKDDKNAQNQINVKEYYPTGDWRTSTPEKQGMDSRILANMINSIKKSGKSVNSITVIRNGYIVNETYYYPYYKGLLHFMNSCTKSIVSALVGISIDDGHIKSVNDKVIGYFPNLNIANVDQHKQNLKIRNLLTMTTGLDWVFSNNASTNKMLQSRNWTQFTLDQPMKEEPGHTFNYCNGAAHLLSTIIQKTTGISSAELTTKKFELMGIKDMYWDSSPENVSSGYTGLYMLPDDAAKFGYLYLKKGKWNGKQLISKKWVEESTKMQVKADWTPIFPGYGYMWWINRFGGYAALGQGGDYIFVVPKLDLVVVFTGGIYNLNEIFYPGELMEKYIVPSVKSNASLKSNPTASEALKKAIDMVQKAPSPEPPSSLPEIAKKISGKSFAMSDSTILTLLFKGDNEFTIEQDSKNLFTIGLDNVYRIVDTKNLNGGIIDHNHLALKGRWIDEKTLEVTTQDLEDGFEEVLIGHFENDQIKVKIKSNVYPEATNTGKLKK
jgi:CubicO group peptidase (beta-lactamase class C family)